MIEGEGLRQSPLPVCAHNERSFSKPLVKAQDRFQLCRLSNLRSQPNDRPQGRMSLENHVELNLTEGRPCPRALV